MNWYLKCLKQYADFNGRAKRTEYWMFILFNMLFSMVVVTLDNVLGLTVGDLPYGFFYFIYTFAIFIPSLAVTVRRLHDIGKSGWMILIGLIPLVGGIWLLVLMLTDSDPEENEYRENSTDDNEVYDAKSSKTMDLLVVIVVAFMLFSRACWFILPKIITDFYLNESYHIMTIVMSLIESFIPLTLAFTVKNKSTRLILFIFGGVYLVYGVVMQFIY